MIQCACGKEYSEDFSFCPYCGEKKPEPPKFNYCKDCNEEFSLDFSFCPKCGKPFKEAKAAPEPVPQPTPQPAPEPAPQPTPQPIPEPAPQPAPEPAPQPSGKALFCLACGAKINRDMVFCKECGTRLKKDGANASQDSQQPGGSAPFTGAGFAGFNANSNQGFQQTNNTPPNTNSNVPLMNIKNASFIEGNMKGIKDFYKSDTGSYTFYGDRFVFESTASKKGELVGTAAFGLLGATIGKKIHNQKHVEVYYKDLRSAVVTPYPPNKKHKMISITAVNTSYTIFSMPNDIIDSVNSLLQKNIY